MIVLQEELFKRLCNTLEIIGHFCTDVLVKENCIRQFSDDRVLVISIQLTQFEDTLTFNLSDVKRKIKILKLFNGDVSLNISDNMVSFNDDVMKLSFAHPVDDVLVNQHISDEAFSNMINFDSLTLVVNEELPETVVDRINTLSDAFNVRRVLLSPADNNQYKIIVESQDKNQKAEIYKIQAEPNSINGTLVVPRDLFMCFSGCPATFQLFTDNDRIIGKLEGIIDDVLVSLYVRIGVDV